MVWEPPEIDGGSYVTNYVVERRNASRRGWTTIETRCSKTTYNATDLQEGMKYFFRVMAENEYGVGEPKESDTAIEICEKSCPPEIIIVIANSIKTKVT